MSRESWEVSEQAFWEQFDHREVDSNGNYPGEPITHSYPLTPQRRILVGNESVNKELPF